MIFFLDLAAIVFFIFLAPIPVFWCVFQARVSFWKRFGRGVYAAALFWYGIVATIVLTALPWFIAARFPVPPVLGIVGMGCVFLGLMLGAIASKELSLATLVSLPQIFPQQYPSRLITTGLYSVVRHPRYLGYWITSFGFALTTGMLAMWTLFLWALIGFLALGFIEEHELQQRFGGAYTTYMKKVPRFIPRMW